MNKYWDIKPIWNTGATYMQVIGMRSNGKTYGALKKGLELFAATGCQMGIIRRWLDDFKGKRGQTLFAPLIENGLVSDIFEGEWNTIVFKSMQWFLAREEDGQTVYCSTPIAYAFALTAMTHDKSTSYPNIRYIIFDEFLDRNGYLPNEFDLFTNTISTIVRDKEDVRIIMLANTVSQHSPYFSNMGLINIRKMKQGTIDIYTLGKNAELKIAVEYCAEVERSKEANKYFAFGRADVDMITKGKWEFDIYPRLHEKYKPSQIRKSVFIEFDNAVIQADFIKLQKMYVVLFHPKTTPIKDSNKDIIYNLEQVLPEPNRITNVVNDDGNISKMLKDLLMHKKAYYSDNETGELIRNWLIESKQKSSIIK